MIGATQYVASLQKGSTPQDGGIVRVSQVLMRMRGDSQLHLDGLVIRVGSPRFASLARFSNVESRMQLELHRCLYKIITSICY